MARGTDNATAPEGTAPTDAPATDAAPLSAEDQAKLDAKKAARKARRAQRAYIVVPMPPNLKEVIQGKANGSDKPIGTYVRDFLAQAEGIEIPVTATTRRVKYANDEERDAARKSRRESRSSTMKNLMAEFRKLTAGGMSPEQATAAAAANVQNGVETPEPVAAG